jgi:hypothetical protein
MPVVDVMQCPRRYTPDRLVALRPGQLQFAATGAIPRTVEERREDQVDRAHRGQSADEEAGADGR